MVISSDGAWTQAAWKKELGVEFLTLWAFSTDNWRRPREEIDGIISNLAIVVAAYPFRGLPWLRKYLRAFLLSLFGVYALNILLFSLIAISS